MEERRCYGCMNLVTEEVCPHCGFSAGQNNDPSQLPVGTLLHNQVLVGKVLGQGGFGITYMGMDVNLELPVAIKEFFPSALVNRDSSQDLSVRLNAEDLKQHFESTRERFLREAQALAKLHGIPQVVSVRQFFEENGTAYIVMEYVRGTDLRHILKQRGGSMTAEELLPILEPLLRGLDAVHKANLVHRDISPDNIMLQPDGTPKLLDFGAVRVTEKSDTQIDLSHSTEAILKHGFAPIEQYRSRGSLGPWTDEYGICATVYYCLTGRVPPDAPARAMGDEDVDWSAVPGLQEHQRLALAKGMSMRAKDRFGSMEQLRRAIFDAPKSIPTPPPAPQPPEPEPEPEPVMRRSHGLLWTLIVLVLTGALFVTGLRHVKQLELGTVLGKFGVGEDTVTGLLEDWGAILEEEVLESMAQELPEETLPTEPLTGDWLENVMIYDPFKILAQRGISRSNVRGVTFLDAIPANTGNAVDVSRKQDRSVLAWAEWTDGCQIYFAAEGGINGQNSSQNLFKGCTNLKTVSFNGAYFTDAAENLSRMFYGCIYLEHADLETLNTSRVTNMSYMFYMADCEKEDIHEGTKFNTALTQLNIGRWDISRLKNAEYMFYGCTGISALPVESWTPSSLYNMKNMFARTGLKQVDLSAWDQTGGGTASMHAMFRDCAQLETARLGTLVSARILNLSYLFSGCQRLETVDTANWDVSLANSFQFLFQGCESLSSLDVTGWDVSNAENMSGMFSGCTALRQLNVTDWSVGKVMTMSHMFEGTAIAGTDFSKWDVSNVRTTAYMFCNCPNLQDSGFGNWDISRVTNMESMFYNCTSLDNLELEGWKTAKAYAHKNFCSEWTYINGSHWEEFFRP